MSNVLERFARLAPSIVHMASRGAHMRDLEFVIRRNLCDADAIQTLCRSHFDTQAWGIWRVYCEFTGIFVDVPRYSGRSSIAARPARSSTSRMHPRRDSNESRQWPCFPQ